MHFVFLEWTVIYWYLSRKAMASSCTLSKRSSFVPLKYGYSTYRTYPDKSVMRTATIPTINIEQRTNPIRFTGKRYSSS